MTESVRADGREIVEMLRNVQFLREVSDELILQLAGISQAIDFPAGSVVFRQGEPARTIFLVVEGEVVLELCAAGVGCRRILTVGPGDLLGWSPVLENERLTATARTVEATRLIALDGAQLRSMGERSPRLGYEFMKRAALALAKRLTATRMQLVDVYGSQMPASLDSAE
ncbi:MAG: cyclic nucleotide-binding domain-containing protein [Planctomycetales bacterium]